MDDFVDALAEVQRYVDAECAGSDEWLELLRQEMESSRRPALSSAVRAVWTSQAIEGVRQMEIARVIRQIRGRRKLRVLTPGWDYAAPEEP
jgi:hypothetical protein